MIEDGAKFTISTVQTQATVRELLQGVDLRYPIVTMDGAALYDVNTLEYIRTKPMSDCDAYRVVKGKSEFAGYSFMKIYDAHVSRAAMLKELAAMLGAEKTVTFGIKPDNDFALTNEDRNLMVKKLRDSFEPVDFRCWRSIFRL